MNSNQIYDVLKRYKQRLVSATSRGTSFFITKTDPKKIIDLVEMDFLFGNNESLDGSLLSSKTIRYRSSTDKLQEFIQCVMPAEEYNFEQLPNTSNLKNVLKNITLSDIDEILDVYKLDMSLVDKNEKLKAVASRIFDKRRKEQEVLYKRFDKLISSNNSSIRDTGKDDLFIGFPIIEGKFLSGKEFRAPLVLHKASILKKTNEYVVNFTGGKIFNPIFFNALLNENDLVFKQFNWELDENEDYIEQALRLLDEENIDYQLPEESDLTRFKSYQTKKIYQSSSKISINQFNIMYDALVGMFPLSDNRILYELAELEETKLTKEDSIVSFFEGNNDYLDESDRKLKESEIFSISPLDLSQKLAIQKSLEESLVIQGPPGTGKSQTIVNIIANLVARRKKVLLISEKIAALSVVYNRLGHLNENALIIKDYLKDKEDFYKQINKILSKLNESSDTRYGVNGSRHNIDNINETLEDFFTAPEIVIEKIHKGYNLEDVLNMYDNIDLIDYYPKTSSALTNFIDEYQCSKSDIEEIFYTVFENECFKSMNKLHEEYSNHNIDDISFNSYILTNDMLENNMTENAILYNITSEYYELEAYDFFKIKRFDFKHQSITENFEGIDELAKKYWNLKNRYDEKFDLINTRKFLLFKENLLEYIDLFNQWTKNSVYNNKLTLKKIMNPEHEQSVFQKIFKRIELSDDESRMYEYIQEEIIANYINTLQMNLNSRDEEVLYALKSLKIDCIEDFKAMLIKSNYVRINFLPSESILKRIKRLDVKFSHDDFENYKRIDNNYRKLYFSIIEEGISIEEFKSLVDICYVGMDTITGYFNEHQRMQNYESEYAIAKNTILDKIESSSDTVYYILKKAVKSRIFSNNLIELDRQANLKRKKNIKTIFDRFFDDILNISPIMLMTPEAAASLLPLEGKLFDYAIYDEASQMYIEKAIPTMYRADKIIVAGDSKQLKPSSLFSSRVAEGDELEMDEDIDNDMLTALEVESLLDGALAKYKKTTLLYHYRSEYKELIDFSNSAFYNNELIFSSKNENLSKFLPIETINVPNGRWEENRTNIAEAKEVVKLIKKILKERKNNETVGVITFNASQKDYIQDILDIDSDDSIKKEFERFNQKKQEDESLFVKNIENVQGDERDIIIFSIGYARNTKGRVINSFGSLSQEGGENRLNVAITRAKKKIYVIKSIHSSELSVNEQNRGPSLFKKYLQYVEFLQKKDDSNVSRLLNSIVDIKENYDDSSLKFDSPFEEEVYDAIKARLDNSFLELHSQVPSAGYKIDLAVYDKRLDRYILAIECDGAAYHSKIQDVERDFYRQEYLESRGWNVTRIFSTIWWINKENETERVINELNKLLEKIYQDEKIDISENVVRKKINTSSINDEKISYSDSKTANKYTIGDRVEHTVFGYGIVSKVGIDNITATFARPHGPKVIKADTPAIKKL